MRILTLCGSLREESSNFQLLRAAQHFWMHHTWEIGDLAGLPFFDPDAQYGERTPAPVLRLRASGAAADLLLIFTPEYAHGIPGVLKNGLEWLFHEGTARKPAAVVIGASQGESTRAQLLDVLTTMDFAIDESRALLLKGARTRNPELLHRLEEFLGRLSA